MELRDYLRVLRKQWRLIVFCTLLAVAAAAALTAQATPQYQTSVQFYVSAPSSADSARLSGADINVQASIVSYADVLEGPFTAEAVARAVPGLSIGQVRGRISADPVAGTVLLSTTVTDASPERALTIAEALTTQFPAIVQQLEQRPDGAAPAITARVTRQPELPTSPVSPQPVRNLLAGLVLGLVLGVSLALAREVLDNTVKNPDDVRDVAGTATLGAIAYDPQASKKPLIVSDSPRSGRSEAFRQLRTNLQFVQVDGPLRSLVLTSSVPREGKSTSACNLAITLAQAGVRVCLLEGDLRRPRVADYLGLESAVGLTDVLIGRVTLEDALQSWGGGMLKVLPSGPLPPNPSELLSSRGMGELMKSLEQRFNLVLVDAPPLLPVTDAAILATLTDGAVLCVRARSTRKEQLAQAADALRSVDAKILGVVLTMVPTKGPDAYQGYGYGYGSYKSDTRKPQMSAEDAVRALGVPPPAAAPATSPALAAPATSPAPPAPPVDPPSSPYPAPVAPPPAPPVAPPPEVEHPPAAEPARPHERLPGESAPADRYY